MPRLFLQVFIIIISTIFINDVVDTPDTDNSIGIQLPKETTSATNTEKLSTDNNLYSKKSASKKMVDDAIPIDMSIYSYNKSTAEIKNEPVLTKPNIVGVSNNNQSSSSVDTYTDNTTVDSYDLNSSDSKSVNANMSWKKTWKIKNTGNVSARLLVKVENIINAENGCSNDQERHADPTCGVSNDDGDLGKIINLNISLDGFGVASSALTKTSESKILSDFQKLLPVILKPGESKIIKAHFLVNENDYGNEIQGDSAQFSVVFILEDTP